MYALAKLGVNLAVSLNNLKLKPHEALIDKENITIPGIWMPEGKRPARSIIENIKQQHSHEVDG